MTRTPTKAQMRAAYDVELRALQKIIEDQNATLSDIRAKTAILIDQKVDAVQVAVAAENLADERRKKITALELDLKEYKQRWAKAEHAEMNSRSMAVELMRALAEGLNRD